MQRVQAFPETSLQTVRRTWSWVSLVAMVTALAFAINGAVVSATPAVDNQRDASGVPVLLKKSFAEPFVQSDVPSVPRWADSW